MNLLGEIAPSSIRGLCQEGTMLFPLSKNLQIPQPFTWGHFSHLMRQIGQPWGHLQLSPAFGQLLGG